MTAAAPVFLGRSDTFFGVCEALGQDLGFNANWLRVAFGVGVLANPLAVVAIYLALGLAVLASRLIFPIAVRSAPIGRGNVSADNDTQAAPLKIAA